MAYSSANWIIKKVSDWLLHNSPPRRAFLCDFQLICEQIYPGDVLLIEGRNRISSIIQLVTHSPWTHAALYIGTPNDIQDATLKEKVSTLPNVNPLSQLLVESDVGIGTVISPITKYQDDHIRILRPQGLSANDIQKVIDYAIGRLGKRYDVRHVFDLLRFLIPWGLFPKTWRSTLFAQNALQPTEDICSSMIADAFHSIDFPILPLVEQTEDDNLELIQRNPRLFTPSDFDYSPYFNVIKYPIFALGKNMRPQDLPWKKGIMDEDI